MPLPVAVAAAPAVIGAIKGISDIIGGGSDYSKLKKEMDALATPFYKIQDEYLQNRDVAANRASQGFGASQLDYLTGENQRGTGAAISALMQGGGGVNDLAEIMDVYSRTAARTAAEDAELQTQNIATFFNANKDLAGQKTTQWHMNEYQPWANKQSLLSQQMQIAKRRQDQGWNSIISGISGSVTAFQNNDLLKKMTPTGGSAVKEGQAGMSTVPVKVGETLYNRAEHIPGNRTYADFITEDFSEGIPELTYTQPALPSAVPLGSNQIPSSGARGNQTDIVAEILKNIWK